VGDFVFSLDTIVLTDLMILAINTSEVAVAEENVANSVCPNESGFFTVVSTVGRNDRKVSRIAASYFIV
jgi:hypothetical protein